MIERAFAEGKDVTIGLTSDAFVKAHKTDPDTVSPYDERKKALIEYLMAQGWGERAAVIPIDDAYEPAASDFYDAIVVTTDNKQTGEEINNLRRGRTLQPLVLVEAPIVAAEDGEPISSTRVRGHTIDENGKLVMPEELRTLLKKPMGELLKTKEEIHAHFAAQQGKPVITVGDVSTKEAVGYGLRPVLAIIDLHVAREPYQPLASYDFGDTPIEHVHSGPGFISVEVRERIKLWAQKREPLVLVVDGEEDLLALPAIANVPDGGVVYYGQPGEGLVAVPAAEGYRKKALDILAQFT